MLWQKHWKFFPTKEVNGAIGFLSQTFFPIRIHHQFIQVLVDDIMRKQHIWQWCIVFENSRTDVHDVDHTCQQIASETCVTAGVEDWFWFTAELQFQSLLLHCSCPLKLLLNGCDCKSLISTVSELLNACQDGIYALVCSGIGWKINETCLE